MLASPTINRWIEAKLLSPTGTILWDDYFYMYPGVVRYLERLVDEGRRLHVIRGTNVVIYDQRLE